MKIGKLVTARMRSRASAIEETQMSQSPPGSTKPTDDQANVAMDRRRFLTSGAAMGAAAVAAAPAAQAQTTNEIKWDREADVVVLGAGAGGLVASIAAREKGASVIAVEMNFDIGGRCMMSFGGLYIGGGNRLQQEKGQKDTPDLVFAHWSRTQKPIGRFSDRNPLRTSAGNKLHPF